MKRLSLVLAVLVVSVSGCGTIPWTKFQHDGSNRGQGAAGATYKGKTLWKFTLGGAAETAPALSADEKTLYVGGDDGLLYALSVTPTEATKLWSKDLGGPIHSSPAVADGVIYVGANDNCLHAIDANGNEKWKFKTEGAVESSPSPVGTTIYFGSDDGNVYAVDTTGKEIWKHKLEGAVSAAPAIGTGGDVYITSLKGDLVRLDAKTGKQVAKAEGVFSAASVTLGLNDTVYIGKGEGMAKLDADLKPLRAFVSQGNIGWIPAAVIIQGGKEILYASTQAGLFAIDPASMTQLWVVQGPPPLPTVTSAPSGVLGGQIFWAAGQQLFGYTPDGKMAWNVLADSGWGISVAIASDGTIYASNRAGMVYAIH